MTTPTRANVVACQETVETTWPEPNSQPTGPTRVVGPVVGNLVGMAFVVVRPKGRFEIRESVHTKTGPRARSLANFASLTDEVLAKARARASRPFDADAVRASASRAGAELPVRAHPRRRRHSGAADSEARRFVESSRRMASSIGSDTRPSAAGPRPDPGDALIDLLGFVAQVKAFTPDRAPEPLDFPPLARVARETAERLHALEPPTT
jgi:hypothetical protein